MSIRLSRLATGVLVVAAMLLMTSRSWAIYYGLGPSKDEWGLKYEVAVEEADRNNLTVTFTLADEGRLKPIYSIELIAFSKQADSQGRRAYDIKAPFKFKTGPDGRRTAQVQIRKDIVDGAEIRILTQMVDGRRQPSGGSYYDIPLKKYLNKAPSAPSPIALPKSTKVAR
jgi:hypothetical protein